MKQQKTRFLIDVHSFVDIITNSSTELFMTDETKSVKEVEKILRKLIRQYNQEIKKGKHNEWAREANFGDFNVYLYTANKHKEAKKYGGWGYERKEDIGKIVIESTDDNSIPYEMFDTISDTFNARRHHLG